MYQLVNESYIKAFNKSYQDIVGRSVSDLLGPDVFQVIKEKLDRCLEGETICFQEWFEIGGLGRCYIDVVYTPYIEAGDKIDGVLVSVHNITELKKVEESRPRKK